jgi:hypothetical protein
MTLTPLDKKNTPVGGTGHIEEEAGACPTATAETRQPATRDTSIKGVPMTSLFPSEGSPPSSTAPRKPGGQVDLVALRMKRKHDIDERTKRGEQVDEQLVESKGIADDAMAQLAAHAERETVGRAVDGVVEAGRRSLISAERIENFHFEEHDTMRRDDDQRAIDNQRRRMELEHEAELKVREQQAYRDRDRGGRDR